MLLPIAVAQSILKVKNLKEHKFDEIVNFGGMKTVISMKKTFECLLKETSAATFKDWILKKPFPYT